MITKLIRQRQIYAFMPILWEKENIHDIIDDPNKLFPEENQTGFQRLRRLFQRYEDQPIHPRLITVYQTVFTSFILGGLYGAMTKSRETFIDFIENNEATQFRNHIDAKRKLADKMFLSFMSGGLKWGIRVSVFCTSFVTGYTLIAVYRNKDTPLFYSFAGMCAGAIYKFPLGPKGMISGGIVGGFFGSVYAGLKSLLFKFANMSEQEINEKKYGLKKDRDEVVNSFWKHVRAKEDKEELIEILKENKLK